MSKFDRIIAEALLFKKEPKVVKEKKSKVLQALEDEVARSLLEDLKKKLEKKEEKKEEKKGWWAEMSPVQKVTILMITVPIGVMIEMFILLKIAVSIGMMVH